MKSRIGAGISIGIAVAFILISSLGAISQVSATYPIGPIAVSMHFGDPEFLVEGAPETYYGPTTSMVQLTNGSYLAFIRHAATHVNISDYGIMESYFSLDGATWEYNSTTVDITKRDVRNYAAGTTSTGRIILFYSIMDVDNDTVGEESLQVIYSDDEGITWSPNQTILAEMTIDGYTPQDVTAHGEVKQMGNGRIGVTTYAMNISSWQTQTRFAYSDDNGLIWSQVAISDNNTLDGVPGEGNSEADMAYLGNNQLVVMTRVNCPPSPGNPVSDMFTSTDNGLTWVYRGRMTVEPTTSDFFPPSLTTFIDTIGVTWVLAIFAEGTIIYTYASGQALMSSGINAWPDRILIDAGPGPPAQPWMAGIYATGIFDSSGSGIMTFSQMHAWNDSDMVVVDLTASRDYTNAQIFTIRMVGVIGMFLVVGIIAAVALAAVEPLRNEKKKITVDHLIRMFMFIVIGMAVIGVYYSMFT